MHIDWIIANKGWLFSGLFVAVPIALLNWLIGTWQNRRSQTQKSGDCSVNTQVEGQTQKSGDNCINFQAGRDIVVTKDVLEKPREQHSAGLKQAQEPDSQHASFAQPGSAHAVGTLPCGLGEPITAGLMTAII